MVNNGDDKLKFIEHWLRGGGAILVLLSCAALLCAQSPQPLTTCGQEQIRLIITGWAANLITKQFEQWTAQLQRSLSASTDSLLKFHRPQRVDRKRPRMKLRPSRLCDEIAT
jgi:hypothetical protein